MNDASEELPRLLCYQRELGEVLANPEAEPWRSLVGVTLHETVSGLPPQQATCLKVAWSPAELRILFFAEDTHIVGTYTERDSSLYEEEVVEIFIDASGESGDPQAYFEIEVNPLNTVMDLALRRVRSGLKRDFSWRCDGLRTAVKRFDIGWASEISIPFASVGALPRQPLWRANFFRIDRPAGKVRELSAWSPTRALDFHRPERFGFLEFVD